MKKRALKAMKLIKVKYKILVPALLDFHQAKDNEILVHPEEDWACTGSRWAEMQGGTWLPVKSVVTGTWMRCLQDCDEVLEHAPTICRSFNQAMMETFRTYTELDRHLRKIACDLLDPDRISRSHESFPTALGNPQK